MKELPDNCPQCLGAWTRQQSTFFRHLEFVHCETCKANAETIVKRVEADPSLKGTKKKPYTTCEDWGRSYWDANDFED